MSIWKLRHGLIQKPETMQNIVIILYKDKPTLKINKLIDYLNFSADFYKKFDILKESNKERIAIKFDDDLVARKFIALMKIF